MSEITVANRNPNPQILCKTSEKQHQGKREERESMLLLQNKLPLINVKKKKKKKKILWFTTKNNIKVSL